MNLNMTFGQAACQLLCRYSQSTLAASCVCWIIPIVTSDSIVAVHVWYAPDQWHNWRVAGVQTAPPCQAKCKKRAPTLLVFWYLLLLWFL